MVHCADRTINLTPLPSDHRRSCLRETFDHLEPGQRMQVIDDFHPGWIQAFLEEENEVDLSGERFMIEENAGRYVVYIEKPSTNTARPVPECGARGTG